MNYLTYPFKTMRITQNYNGTTSHKPHTTGKPADFPLDEGGTDGNRDWIYCPCDEIVIKRIYGVGNGGINTMFLESTSKVDFADGTNDYCCIQITHPNDSDLKRLKVGQKFKRGEKICQEGTDGATANHIHHSVGKGKYKGTGWVKNSNGKFVIDTEKGGVKPEKAYFIDPSFTKCMNKGSLTWKNLPKEEKKAVVAKNTTTTYEVTASVLNVRTLPSKTGAIKSFSELSSDAQKKVLAIRGVRVNGYVKGMKFSVSEIVKSEGYTWGKTPSGWVALDYCKVVK